MEKSHVSTHKLTKDYSLKGKIKSVVIAWVVFLVVFGVTRMPDIQSMLLGFSASVTVNWVTSIVNFIINGFWVFGIGLIIFTPYTLLKKQSFDEMRLYDTGIVFYNSKSKDERYAVYSDVRLSYGRLQESFHIESKVVGVKMAEYGWRDFSQSDVLRSNLERYGKWN